MSRSRRHNKTPDSDPKHRARQRARREQDRVDHLTDQLAASEQERARLARQVAELTEELARVAQLHPEALVDRGEGLGGGPR